MPQNRQKQLSGYETVYAFGVCIGDDVFTKHGPPIMNLVWMFEIAQHTEVVHCMYIINGFFCLHIPWTLLYNHLIFCDVFRISHMLRGV